MNYKYLYLLSWCLLLAPGVVFAGNPDRQGEAGAPELLINPWARSAGLHSMSTSMVTGTDAFFLNVAGLSRIKKTEIQLAHTRYLQGADININALGFAQRVGKSGAFGISLMSFDLGEFDLTTYDNPEGSGATFSPSFFNLSVGYSQMYANKVSVGVLFKFVNESIANAGARAFALDAGVQYVTGEQDNFKFGIALRNVGSKLRFSGEGLAQSVKAINETYEYQLSLYQRSSDNNDLPSQLNIGASYDWIIGKSNRLTLVGNFTANSYSRDQVGGGLEFALGPLFSLRAGYKYEFDAQNSEESSLDNGFSGGLSVSFPLRKGSNSRLGLDYAYRSTKIYDGIHNLSLRIDL